MSTNLKLATFASKPFIQGILRSAHSPRCVLSFFYGVDYDNAEEFDRGIKQGHCLSEMSDLWFSGGPEYDNLCQSFTALIRKVGRRELDQEPDWKSDTTESLVAQLILCDQFPRNVFRRMDEAFAYDETALDIARTLAKVILQSEDAEKIEGEIYPPYCVNVNMGLMHSENSADHEALLAVIDYCDRTSPPHLSKWWAYQREFALDHKKVVDRFGRYPHRNHRLGRENTKEEDEWLADTEHLPGWAKSQM